MKVRIEVKYINKKGKKEVALLHTSHFHFSLSHADVEDRPTVKGAPVVRYIVKGTVAGKYLMSQMSRRTTSAYHIRLPQPYSSESNSTRAVSPAVRTCV